MKKLLYAAMFTALTIVSTAVAAESRTVTLSVSGMT